ncbi:MAG: hypothetical protein LVQ96_03990 [Thermoplasmatales archaeon]|nr:hypothetical protein [Thermoplasmatales archaeon]MCW6170314.1 hypothetical protein [Thermoplasmatales archaeon]
MLEYPPSLGRNSVEDFSFEEAIKEEKLAIARRFVNRLSKKDILFAGVSGSVSYKPKAEDDIDIFLITRTNRLWSGLLKAFITRRLFRNKDICISLAFDDRFVVSYFKEKISGLPLKDSVNVVSIFGQEYYEDLISNSPRIRDVYSLPRKNLTGERYSNKTRNARLGIIEEGCFFVLSCWLELKSMYTNSKIRREGPPDDQFETILGLHHFYLESERYRKMNRLMKEEGINE